MKFTDFFIKRPVFATVISLLIFLLGVQSIFHLPLRRFPKMSSNVIEVRTIYKGASAELIKGFVTDPLQRAIASVDGIDYLTSNNKASVSLIQAHLQLNFDAIQATTDILAKIAEVKHQLPKEAEDSIISRSTGSNIALMYLSLRSSVYNQQQITDYMERLIRPQLETVSGVSEAAILGGKRYAIRIHLNVAKMAASQMTTKDILQALHHYNVQAAAGQLEDKELLINVTTNAALHDVAGFENIIVKHRGHSSVRMRDIAKVSLDIEDKQTYVNFNGMLAVFMGIKATSYSNPLVTISNVKKQFQNLKQRFPAGLKGSIVYDATEYIREAIYEVIKTLIEAMLIVIVVIFLFVGNIRAVVIPIVTIPLSLVGVATCLLAFGYSINLLTLLAMVLAIGLVVDDAIVVLENVHRHIELGKTCEQAAIHGAREIALPIVGMTLTLVAVYLPIGFSQGITGALFKEFAFTLAGAVVVSGIVAISLSPMMCATILESKIQENRFSIALEHYFERLKTGYQYYLHRSLDHRSASVLLLVVITLSCYFFYRYTPHELAPVEDQNILFSSVTAPEYATVDYMRRYTHQFEQLFNKLPEKSSYFIISGMEAPNRAMSGIILTPRNTRKRSQQAIKEILQKKLHDVPGVRTALFPLPPLPIGGDGLPIQFILSTSGDYAELDHAATKLLQAARKSGLFAFIRKNIEFNRPQIRLLFNRDKASVFGINMLDLSELMLALYSGAEVNKFSMQDRSYKVITELEDFFRTDTQSMRNVYLRTANDKMIPLSSFLQTKLEVRPNQLTQFQQLNSISIEGVPRPGSTLAEGLDFLKRTTEQQLSSTVHYDYSGQSRQFMKEGDRLIWIFIFAVIVIFLVLAAQFESFRDSLIILSGMPASICCALIPLNLGLASINIYTQIGMVTLVGVISKHGILMVDFANHLRISENLNIREAIEKASAIRLRPILMTSASLIFGVIPLMLSQGAGAESQFSMGIVIASGMFLGTICTLFITPAIYTLLTSDHKRKAILE